MIQGIFPYIMKLLKRLAMFNPGMKFVWRCIIVFCVFSCVTGYIFYNNIWYGIILVPIFPFLYKREKHKYIQRQKRIFADEFNSVIEMLSANLNAGYSLENAFVNVTREFGRVHSDSIYMRRELLKIINGLRCNYSVEALIIELGEMCDIDDVREFGSLLATAKRYGGNIIRLIKQTKDNIMQKNVVILEIETTIAAKKMEGNIMLFMPYFIVLYMKITNGQYISGIYETVSGKIVMTAMLGMWFLAMLLIQKITDLGDYL